jgi:membrane-bound ClpP family serine protease
LLLVAGTVILVIDWFLPVSGALVLLGAGLFALGLLMSDDDPALTSRPAMIISAGFLLAVAVIRLITGHVLVGVMLLGTFVFVALLYRHADRQRT